MPAKPKLQYRLICAKHGERGHSTHAYNMPDDKKRRAQKVIDADHHTEMLAARSAERSGYYAAEAPWTLEEREVGKWRASK